MSSLASILRCRSFIWTFRRSTWIRTQSSFWVSMNASLLEIVTVVCERYHCQLFGIQNVQLTIWHDAWVYTQFTCQYFPTMSLHKNWHHISHPFLTVIVNNNISTLKIKNAKWLTFQHLNTVWKAILLKWHAVEVTNWLVKLFFLQCKQLSSCMKAFELFRRTWTVLTSSVEIANQVHVGNCPIFLVNVQCIKTHICNKRGENQAWGMHFGPVFGTHGWV